MEQKEFITTYSEEKEYKLADLKDFEVDLLRRVIDICWEAREKGNHPFGCLLADAEGNILMEQGNEENSLSGDCTAHAETHLMRKASQKYSKKNCVTSPCTTAATLVPCAQGLFIGVTLVGWSISGVNQNSRR